MNVLVIVSREPIDEQLTQFEDTIPYLVNELQEWTDVPEECIPTDLKQDKMSDYLIQSILSPNEETEYQVIASYIVYQLTKLNIPPNQIRKLTIHPTGITLQLEINPHGHY